MDSQTESAKTDSISKLPPRGRGPIWARRIALALGVVILMGLGYRVWRNFETTKLKEQYAFTGRILGRLSDDLYQFWTQSHRLLPYKDTKDGPVLDIDSPFFHNFPLNMVLSPQSAQNLLSDPYFADSDPRPLRFWSEGGRWTAWSAGPDLDYDLKDPKLYAGPRKQLQEVRPKLEYDPTNGLRSSGDIIAFGDFAPEESQ